MNFKKDKKKVEEQKKEHLEQEQYEFENVQEFDQTQQQAEQEEVNLEQEQLSEQEISTDYEIEQEQLNQTQSSSFFKKGSSDKKEIQALKKALMDAEVEIANKQAKIEQLQNQLDVINYNYKTEVTRKGEEAQKILDQKIIEFRNNFEKELKHAKKFALKDKAVDLINIINQFENVVSYEQTDPKINNYLQGFRMFSDMFKNYLSSNDIKEIVVNPHDEFDHATMEGFSLEEKEGFKTNSVIKVIKKGYTLHDIVLLPAQVIVAK